MQFSTSDIELSISQTKIAARSERQPVRYDVYLNHIEYLEKQLQEYKNIIKYTKLKVNYKFSAEAWKKAQHHE